MNGLLLLLLLLLMKSKRTTRLNEWRDSKKQTLTSTRWRPTRRPRDGDYFDGQDGVCVSGTQASF